MHVHEIREFRADLFVALVEVHDRTLSERVNA